MPKMLAVTALLSVACGAEGRPTAAHHEVGHRNVAVQFLRDGYPRRQEAHVVRTPSEWRRVWQWALSRGRADAKKPGSPPVINFTKSSLIVVAFSKVTSETLVINKVLETPVVYRVDVTVWYARASRDSQEMLFEVIEVPRRERTATLTVKYRVDPDS